MTRGLVGGVVLGVLYVVISQLVGFAHLLLAAALEWRFPDTTSQPTTRGGAGFSVSSGSPDSSSPWWGRSSFPYSA
jgi:hypothetical protein